MRDERRLTTGVGTEGESASNERRRHRRAGHGRDGRVAADVRREDVQARGEDVHARTVVREVRALVAEGRRTDGDGLLRSSGGVVARVLVVIASRHSEMHAALNSAIDSGVENLTLATSEGHVGNATLVLALAGLSKLCLSLSQLLRRLLGSPVDTADNSGHGAGAVRAEHFNGDNVGSLGDTIAARSNGSGAVST